MFPLAQTIVDASLRRSINRLTDVDFSLFYFHREIIILGVIDD